MDERNMARMRAAQESERTNRYETKVFEITKDLIGKKLALVNVAVDEKQLVKIIAALDKRSGIHRPEGHFVNSEISLKLEGVPGTMVPYMDIPEEARSVFGGWLHITNLEPTTPAEDFSEVTSVRMYEETDESDAAKKDSKKKHANRIITNDGILEFGTDVSDGYYPRGYVEAIVDPKELNDEQEYVEQEKRETYEIQPFVLDRNLVGKNIALARTYDSLNWEKIGKILRDMPEEKGADPKLTTYQDALMATDTIGTHELHLKIENEPGIVVAYNRHITIPSSGYSNRQSESERSEFGGWLRITNIEPDKVEKFEKVTDVQTGTREEESDYGFDTDEVNYSEIAIGGKVMEFGTSSTRYGTNQFGRIIEKSAKTDKKV